MKRRLASWSRLILITILVCLILTPSVVQAAISDDDRNAINLDTVWFKPDFGAACQNTSAPTGPAAPLDLSTIVQKYNLQSALVKQIGGGVIGSSNAGVSPPTVASVLKLIIADAFLNSQPDLNKTVSVSTTENYFGPGGGDGSLSSPHTGQTIKLGDALEQTLKFSSDTDANVLIDASGGLQKVTDVAHVLGYGATTILSYYNNAGTPTISPNQTTVTDLTNAMEKIYSSSAPNYVLAHKYLHEETVTYGLASDANKWGGTSTVSGNSAVFGLSDKGYIITMYVALDWKGDSTATNPTSGPSMIKNATNDILTALRNSSPTSASTGSSQCCSTNLTGADNAAKVFNFFLGKGLNPVQVAGLAGNFAAESGFDPTAYNPGGHTDNPDPSHAFGLVQWVGGRQTTLRARADAAGKPITDLSVQLDFAWEELNGPYKGSVLTPLQQTSDLATAVHNVNVSYEASGSSDAPRLQAAQDLLTKYGSGVPSGAGAGSTCAGGFNGTIPSGSSQQLALNLLQAHYKGSIGSHSYSGDGKLTCQSLNCNDLDNTANGVSIKNNGGPCAADAISQNTLQALIVLIEQGGFSLGLTALCNDHSAQSSTGTGQSVHNVGKAADIAIINGKTLCDESVENDVLSLLKFLNSTIGTPLAPDQLLNQGVGCGDASTYILANDDLSMNNHQSAPKFTSIYVGDHENHVHVGY